MVTGPISRSRFAPCVIVTVPRLSSVAPSRPLIPMATTPPHSSRSMRPGNTSPAVTFDVNIDFGLSAAERLDEAIDELLADRPGTWRALKALADRIASAPNEHARGGLLMAFTNVVTAQTDRTLTEDEAAFLISLASLL